MTNLPRLLDSSDFSPFFRTSVGFDRLMRMMETNMSRNDSNSYPPYNIEKISEDDYVISMAVAGFCMDDIDITWQDNSLTVTGAIAKDASENPRTYLHRGIATRSFEQKFQLADHIEVKGATMDNGMLTITLVREVPEHKKPRKITINDGETLFNKAKKLTRKAA